LGGGIGRGAKPPSEENLRRRWAFFNSLLCRFWQPDGVPDLGELARVALPVTV
jgi:hypothetical protein